MNAAAIDAKLTVLVTAATKKRLESEAAARKTTVGDIVRRRLDGEPDGDEKLFLTALTDLGNRASKVLRELDTTLAELKQLRATEPKRAEAIRKKTLAGISDAEMRSVRAFFAEDRR